VRKIALPLEPRNAKAPRPRARTLVLFRDGDVADVLIGAQSRAKLAKVLERAVK